MYIVLFIYNMFVILFLVSVTSRTINYICNVANKYLCFATANWETGLDQCNDRVLLL